MELLEIIETQRLNEIDHIVIHVFAYLKTPKYSWVFRSKEGGSFSNSGEHRTLKACAKHVFAVYANKPDITVKVVTIHGYDENDQQVTTSDTTYLYKLAR